MDKRRQRTNPYSSSSDEESLSEQTSAEECSSEENEPKILGKEPSARDNWNSLFQVLTALVMSQTWRQFTVLLVSVGLIYLR